MQIAQLFTALTLAVFATVSTRPAVAEQQFSAFLTGYTYWAAAPNGSRQIARPAVHRKAGGSGTYRDPITLAVGNAPPNGRSVTDFPAGTVFYIPRLRKYAIVVDICADGPIPQSGACQSKNKGQIALNIYVGGTQAGGTNADWCMQRLTGLQNVIINPDAGWPVKRGAITESGCQIY
jgi:hypothetical protein